MKINNIHGKYLDTNVYKVRDEKEKIAAMRKENVVNIEISSSAKKLAEKINQSEDKAFSDRIDKIRQSVLAGTYKVSSEDIADKILHMIEDQKKGSDKI